MLSRLITAAGMSVLIAVWFTLFGRACTTGMAGEDVENIGRCEFDALSHLAAPFWNLDNLEYPAEAISIEPIEAGNRGLRIGDRRGGQSGRYTITLRDSTHDWNPAEVDAWHSVTVRIAADYRGTAMIAVAVPGGGALLDIGHGNCLLWQRVGDADIKQDETATVRSKIADWRAADLHRYTIEWRPTGRRHEMPCRLWIDGQLIKEFRGHDREAVFDSTLEISLENGAGTALIDYVEWNLNSGAKKPQASFQVQRGVRQLFLDDLGIAELDGVSRRVHQPTRHPESPVLRGEHPWEKSSTSVYGTMLYDVESRKFRLWYLCSPAPPASGRKWVEVGGYRRVTGCTLLAYAESADGVHWTKPSLGQLSFEGSQENNLLAIGIDNPEGVGVLLDRWDPDPQRRYKAFFWDRRLPPPDDPIGVDERLSRVPVDPSDLTEAQRAGGMWVAFSPDGIRWVTHGPVLPQGSDTTHSILFDPIRRRYLGYGRMGFGRTVALSESDNGLDWSAPRRVLACDLADGPGGQIYGMPVDRYEGLFIGMFWMYREGTDAKIDTQLALSRDGRRWTRVAERQTFLPNGPDGAWDDGMSRVGRGFNLISAEMAADAPGLLPDTIYMHYSMVNGPHRSPKFPKVERRFPSAVGLVTLRRDGFVSLSAEASAGSVTTRAFVLPSARLFVNVDATDGELQVDLLSGGELLGSSLPVRGDHRRVAVDGLAEALSRAEGQTVSLRFRMRNASLYSYWFDERN